MTRLANFGVSGITGGLLEPKQRNRFRVMLHRFGGLADSMALTQQIVSVTRPVFTFEAIPVDGGFRAGAMTWDDLTVVVRDDVSNIASKRITTQIAAQRDHPTQTFDLDIEMLATDESVIETWHCRACSLLTINYETLDHTTSTPLSIILTVRSGEITQSV
jgi:hypothetical protein